MTLRSLVIALLCIAPAARLVADSPADAAPPSVPAVHAAIEPVKTRSIWQVLGLSQLGKFFNQNHLANISAALQRATGSIAKMVTPGADSEKPRLDPVVRQEIETPLKVQSIRYLATLDGDSYPQIAEALLLNLDDSNEEVRVEALKALEKHCKNGVMGGVRTAKGDSSYGARVTGKDSAAATNRKILERLGNLLLDRDDTGRLKETSSRVRETASRLIEELAKPAESSGKSSVTPAAGTQPRSSFPATQAAKPATTTSSETAQSAANPGAERVPAGATGAKSPTPAVPVSASNPASPLPPPSATPSVGTPLKPTPPAAPAKPQSSQAATAATPSQASTAAAATTTEASQPPRFETFQYLKSGRIANDKDPAIDELVRKYMPGYSPEESAAKANAPASSAEDITRTAQREAEGNRGFFKRVFVR